MTYASGRASFASDVPDDAFWMYARDGGRVDACATSAAAVVLDARDALGLAPLQAWDASLMAALRSRATELAASNAAWAPVRDRLVTEGDRVTRLAVLFALYLAYYEPRGLRFDAIALPDAAELPSLGAAIGGAHEPVVCWEPARDADPTRDDAARDLAVGETFGGVRVHAGEEPPAEMATSSPFEGPSDAVLIVGLLLAAGAAWWLFSKADAHR